MTLSALSIIAKFGFPAFTIIVELHGDIGNQAAVCCIETHLCCVKRQAAILWFHVCNSGLGPYAPDILVYARLIPTTSEDKIICV
jgi:hypothetical protein